MNDEIYYCRELRDSVATRLLKEMRDNSNIPFLVGAVFAEHFHRIGFNSGGDGCPIGADMSVLGYGREVLSAVSDGEDIPLFRIKLVYPNEDVRSISDELDELAISLGNYGFALEFTHKFGSNFAIVTVFQVATANLAKQSLERIDKNECE